jgi:hypothetical protein
VIERVTLISGYAPGTVDPEALARGIADATGGAKVTTWLRADDGGAGLPPSSVLPAGVEDIVPQVAAALEGVAAQHVLVLAGPGTRLEVTPLVAARGSAVPGGTAPGRVLRP